MQRCSAAANATAILKQLLEVEKLRVEMETLRQEQQQKPKPFTRCDMELVSMQPYSNTFLLRGTSEFTKAPVPHTLELHQMKGELHRYAIDPKTNKAYTGWVFPAYQEGRLREFLCYLDGKREHQKIPEDFAGFVTHNKTMQVWRVDGGDWACVTGTVEYPLGSKFYAQTLRKRFFGAFYPEIENYKSKTAVGLDHPEVPYGWLIPAASFDGLLSWMKTLTTDDFLGSCGKSKSKRNDESTLKIIRKEGNNTENEWSCQ